MNDKVTHLFPSAEPDPPQDEVVTAMRALDDITDTAATVVGGIMDLKRQTLSSYSGVQRAADAALITARETLDSSVHADPSWIDTPIFKAGRHYDDKLLELRRSMASHSRNTGTRQSLWIGTGLSLTFVAVIGVVAHFWAIAAIAVALRCFVNIRYADEHNLPFEGRASGRRASSMVHRCLAGHASDSIVLLAIVWVMIHADRPLWAIGSVVAVVVTLFTTLLRVAALQVGAQIYRLTFESVARAGSLLAALVATAMLQPDIPSHGLMWLGLALAGPLLYGLGESVRTTMRLHATDLAFGGALPQVSITVSDETGTHKLFSDVDRIRRQIAPGQVAM